MEIKYSPKQDEFIFAPFRNCFEVAEGAPRSGKTFASIARFALNLIRSRDSTHLITAYSQEQAYRLIIEGDGFGLLHIFENSCQMRHDDNGDHLLLNLPNGDKKVYYKGGGKSDSRKAITGLSLGSVYFCEIDLLNMDMIQECFRRTFAAKDRWHIADLNPPAPQHPVISKVFDVQDTRWTHWTLHDNPIITPERLKEIETVCAKNPYLYKRDWLGIRAIPEGVIYSMFDFERHVIKEVPKDWALLEMYFSGDGGLTDATSVGCYCVFMTPERNYVLVRVASWYYDGGNKAMSVQARELIGSFAPYCREICGRREAEWYIDPACKALRKELELFGVLTVGADNNSRDIKGGRKGIEVGIEYAQSLIQDGKFYVLENDRFGHDNFMQEIGMYCVDQHGNPIDAYNHAMDEFRYAVNHFVKNYIY